MIQSIKRWLRNTSISRKLYFTIGIMTVLIFVLLGTFWFCLNALSAVRAYVSGEGLWSKAQKDAVFHLKEYAYSRDTADFRLYRDKLNVIFGDRIARIELDKEDPDYEVARAGFLQGRNHPQDIDEMIAINQLFRDIYYIDRAIVIWTRGDSLIDHLTPIADKLHAHINAGGNNQAYIQDLLLQLEPINHQVTQLEDEFSYTLGEGSRWLEDLVMVLLVIMTLAAEVVCILITFTVSKGIETGLNNIVAAAENISEGDLQHRVVVDSNDEIGVLATSFNVMTERLEENIHQLKETEENLRHQKERAEASEKVKQVFLANMSHEIRTPMNAILGFARLMEDSALNKEQREYIRAIVKSGDNLLVILNDILDFSKIEAGKISFENSAFNLQDVIESTVVMLRGKAVAKGLKISYLIAEDVPKYLHGDAVRLNQVLINLLSNAIKFTEEGSVMITVKSRVMPGDKVEVQFSVTDTGIGISADHQARIFDSFEQATLGTTRKFGGTGLGLTIVKQLVELQGGNVYVSSTLGKGSEFRFTIPYIKATAPEKAYVESEKESKSNLLNSSLKILVVEDNTLNQLLVKRVLQKRHFPVDIANNGREALEKLEEKEYDVILMDLQMPEMDGYEATRHIRSLPYPRNQVPIIAMTAHTIKGEVEKCMALGMSEYISKPFEPDDLERKIHMMAGFTRVA